MSAASPPAESPPKKETPPSPSNAQQTDNTTETSPQKNSSSTDQSPPPASSPPPPESSPPPASPPPSSPPPSSPPPNGGPPPSSPPPSPSSSPPPASPPPSNSPPSGSPPSDSPPSSSPPPSSPPPSSPPPASTPGTPPSPTSTPPPNDSSDVPSPPPPLFSPPTVFSPPGTPAFPPPPPKAITTPQSPQQTTTPVRPHGPPSSPVPSSSSASPSSSSDSGGSGAMVAGIAVGSLVIVVLCIVIVALICTRRKNKKPQYYMDPSGRPPKGGEQYFNTPQQWRSPQPIDHNIQLPPPPGYMVAPVPAWGPPHSGDYSGVYGSGQHPITPASPNMGGITQFSCDELAAATNGFSQANLLGQGGFGYVHKGILSDKKVVAVKSLKTGSGQGEREFQAEVEIISRVHHRHLVSLVGYCIANQQRLLVYEFVPNKTMEFHLHGKGQPVLDWSIRMRIAVGSAKGLAYLHEDCLPRIIHRDIKAANILVDNKFEAMVADFGLAKLTSDNFTHVSTRVMGTFGYLAPEYASSGKLTEKSDVFSFGVMLLELITGRRPVDTTNRLMEDSLVDWARPLLSKALEDGNFDQLVDPRLEGNYNPNEMVHMATCAAASIRHSARRRPKMSQIVRALEGDSLLEDLNEGVKPGQSSVYNPNGGSTAYDTRAYDADMLKFKKMVMNSQEFNSSEYGSGMTSEYGSSSSGVSPAASNDKP